MTSARGDVNPAPLPAAPAPLTPNERSQLREKAKLGAAALVARMVVLQLVVFAGDVYLRRVLTPADFGAFVIAQFALTFFAYFGDAGLGGALIQQAEEPNETELSSIFNLQLLLSVVIAVVMFTAAPLLRRFWPDLPDSAVWLFRALSVNLVLIAARVVPTMLMERHLQYGRLAVLEVLVTVPFYVTAIGLAHSFGVFALIAAVVVQGVLSVIGAFIMRPWRPRAVLNISALRPLLRFGVTYQIKNVIGFFTGAITPVYAGRMLGQTQLGLIDWAQRLAYAPLRLVQVMARISFPLLSRLQGDERAFARTIERSVQLSAMGNLFFVGVCFGLGPNIVRVVYTDKWMPALPVFYVYAAAMSVGFLAPLVQPALDAVGRPRVNAQLSLAWTAAMWILVPFTTARWGATGFALAIALPTVIGSLGLIIVLEKLIPNARLWPRARASLVGGALVAIAGHYMLSPWAVAPLSFVTSLVVLAASFVGVVVILDRSAIADAISLLRRT